MRSGWKILVPSMLSLACGSLLWAQPSSVVPLPRQATVGSGRLDLGGGLAIELAGHREPRLDRALARFSERLFLRTGIPFAHLEPEYRIQLRVHTAGPGGETQSENEDESYRLRVGADSILLDASTPVGTLRGLETLLQLVRLDEEGWSLPLVEIADRPRFVWRGLLLDSCRHWLPPAAIRRTLDLMAVVKLNVLHWHLTEDQGFRVESRRYPKLHRQGSDGLYYTQEEVRDIVAYARDRGIRVVPEFDLPGHTTSWLVGHPELASLPGRYEIERSYGVQKPALDPSREEVYAFLDAFLGEMATLFPDPVMHIGGDEVEGEHWAESESIQAFMESRGLEDEKALQAHFNRRLAAILEKHGKRMMGWDEIQHPDLPEDVIVQSWRSTESLTESARRGTETVLSWGYYLDHMLPASFHYGVDPLAAAGELDADERGRILGGEACMWTELVTRENLDLTLWPRAAAIAERLWSPADVDDVEDLYRRLEALELHLELAGSKHRTTTRQMLERIADPELLEPLLELAAVLEPLDYYGRHAVRDFDQRTPLDTLDDVVAPESLAARAFSRRVASFLDTREEETAARLRQELETWRTIRSRVESSDGSLPSQLTSSLPLAAALSDAAEVALEALELLVAGENAPQGWRRRSLELLDRSYPPDHRAREALASHQPVPPGFWQDRMQERGGTTLELAPVPAVRALVEGVPAPP